MDKKLTLDGYQTMAARTLPHSLTGSERDLIFALGLCGEAGEVAEMVKKHYGHGHTLNKEVLSKELGDVLWYIAAIASAFGMSLGDLAAQNILKLRARYPEKFTTEDSIARRDVEGS